MTEQWTFPDGPCAGVELSWTLLKDELDSALESLSEVEACAIRLRFGLTDGQPRTLAQISEATGLSREQMRQVEENLKSKLWSVVDRENLD